MQRRDLLLDTCGNEEFNKTLTKTNQVETRIEKEFFPRMEGLIFVFEFLKKISFRY